MKNHKNLKQTDECIDKTKTNQIEVEDVKETRELSIDEQINLLADVLIDLLKDDYYRCK